LPTTPLTFKGICIAYSLDNKGFTITDSLGFKFRRLSRNLFEIIKNNLLYKEEILKKMQATILKNIKFSRDI